MLTEEGKGCNIPTMDKTTIKVWKETRRKLKILAAKEGKPMTQIIDDLVEGAILKRERDGEKT